MLSCGGRHLLFLSRYALGHNELDKYVALGLLLGGEMPPIFDLWQAIETPDNKATILNG